MSFLHGQLFPSFIDADNDQEGNGDLGLPVWDNIVAAFDSMCEVRAGDDISGLLLGRMMP